MAAKSSSDQTFGQCRCCLDFGYHKEIGRPYYSNGVRQVYRETFLETFNLSLTINKKLINMICESCINRLNDATEFKAMVVESERQLLSKTESVSSNTELICVGQDNDTGVQKDHNNTKIKKEEDNDFDWNNDGDEMDTQDAVEEQATEVNSWRLIENSKQVDTNLKGRGGEKIEIEIIGLANANSIIDNIKKTTSEQTNEEGKYVAAGIDLPGPFGIDLPGPFGIDLPGPFKAENMNISRINEKQGVGTGTKSVNTLEIVKKPFACDLCDIMCTSRSKLETHMRTHTGEKPFTCGVCDTKFTLRKNLIDHTRTHTGEKPFSCRICGKTFIQNSILQRHIRTHTGEKPYVCTICGKTFNQSSHLRRHMNTHALQFGEVQPKYIL